MLILVLVLLLVVDGRGSFSAVDAHIFSHLVQSVLENIHCDGVDDFLWQKGSLATA